MATVTVDEATMVCGKGQTGSDAWDTLTELGLRPHQAPWSHRPLFPTKKAQVAISHVLPLTLSDHTLSMLLNVTIFNFHLITGGAAKILQTLTVVLET